MNCKALGTFINIVFYFHFFNSNLKSNLIHYSQRIFCVLILMENSSIFRIYFLTLFLLYQRSLTWNNFKLPPQYDANIRRYLIGNFCNIQNMKCVKLSGNFAICNICMCVLVISLYFTTKISFWKKNKWAILF